MILGKEYEFRFPFLMWFPTEIDTWFKYALAQINQILCGFICGMVIMITEALSFSIITILLMLFDNICTELENMVITGEKKDLIKLNHLIAVHQKLLVLADINANIFSVLYLCNYTVSTVIICLTFFQVSTVHLFFVFFRAILANWNDLPFRSTTY